MGSPVRLRRLESTRAERLHELVVVERMATFLFEHDACLAKQRKHLGQQLEMHRLSDERWIFRIVRRVSRRMTTHGSLDIANIQALDGIEPPLFCRGLRDACDLFYAAK